MEVCGEKGKDSGPGVRSVSWNCDLGSYGPVKFSTRNIPCDFDFGGHRREYSFFRVVHKAESGAKYRTTSRTYLGLVLIVIYWVLYVLRHR